MIEKLEGTRETVNFEEGLIAKLHDNEEAESYPTHWHLPIEIVMPVKNHYGIRCGKVYYDLRQEDILLIQPGVLHECIAPDTGRRFFCQISLPQPLISMKLYSSISLVLPQVMLIIPERDAALHTQARELLYKIYQPDDGSTALADFSRYLTILQLIHLIYTHFENSPSQVITKDATKLETIALLEKACAHIREHYAEDIVLDDTARMVGFSRFYFTRLFKAHTGETFCQYLNTVRMQNAQSMLTDQDKSITNIAYSVGYTSMSSFNRMFRNFFGCTPTAYRHLLERK